MGAPGLTSPIRPEGFENLQLNAGVFIKNFNVSGIFDAAGLRAAVAAEIAAGTKILGMTTGGGTFTVTRDTRVPEVDGRRYLHKCAQFVDSMDANITGTLIEIVPANWQAVIGTAAMDETASSTYRKVMKMRTAIDPDTDYLTNIVWVGDIADGRYVAIEVSNALNTADIAFTFQDKNEGQLPFEMHAHQDNVHSYDTAPARLLFFEEGIAFMPSFNVRSSMAGQPKTLSPELPAGQYLVSFESEDLLGLIQDYGFAMEITLGQYDIVTVAEQHHIGGNVFCVPITTSAAAQNWQVSGGVLDSDSPPAHYKTAHIKNFTLAARQTHPTISVEGGTVTPAFDPETRSYRVVSFGAGRRTVVFKVNGLDDYSRIQYTINSTRINVNPNYNRDTGIILSRTVPTDGTVPTNYVDIFVNCGEVNEICYQYTVDFIG